MCGDGLGGSKAESVSSGKSHKKVLLGPFKRMSFGWECGSSIRL
jgi:hypothetical protein